MHQTRSTDARYAAVVERDWVTDEWVVTRSLVLENGTTAAVHQERYETALWGAEDVVALLWGQ